MRCFGSCSRMLIHVPFIQFVAQHFFASFHSHRFIEIYRVKGTARIYITVSHLLLEITVLDSSDYRLSSILYLVQYIDSFTSFFNITLYFS